MYIIFALPELIIAIYVFRGFLIKLKPSQKFDYYTKYSITAFFLHDNIKMIIVKRLTIDDKHRF